MLKKIGIFPHPPIVIPEVGKNDTQKVINTYKAMETLGKEFALEGIKKVVVISPHGPSYRGALAINTNKFLTGDLGQFNYDKKFKFKNNEKLVNVLIEHGYYGVQEDLDHGALVPLYFLEKFIPDLEIVSISTGFMEMEELEEKGKVIGNLLNDNDSFRNENYGLIISADLSHRLRKESHYGFSVHGPVFDRLVYDAIKEGRLDKIKNIPEKIVDGAGQCGFFPLVLASFALTDLDIKTRVLNYEGPFGVGYLVGEGEINYGE